MRKIKDLIQKEFRMDMIVKMLFIFIAILLIIPSLIYLIQNKTIMHFNTYYNFFINDNFDKKISTTIYLTLLGLMTFIYMIFIKNKDIFKNLKQVLILVGITSGIFVFMLPWTTSDIFYYMGVGELHSVYGQNPYYITTKKFYEEQDPKPKDEVLENGAKCYWGNTTVVYGPVAQLFFSMCAKLSFKNINICILIFKIVNLIFHILNCYIIYKITKKLKFVIIYGLNPFMFLEFIGNVHNDIILVFFTLLSLYYLLKKKKILISVILLGVATGIKYFTILLLPVYVLYHYRDEKKLIKRFGRCIQYGIIFLLVLIIEYAVFYKDTSIFTAMMVQTERYSCSIYSGIIAIGRFVSTDLDLIKISKTIRKIVFFLFVILYIKFCIDLITTKNIKFREIIKKYNIMLIFFMISLTNFHQWYFIWIFITLMWQRSDMIKSVMGLTIASEVANSIYMYKFESWIFDMHMVSIFITFCFFWECIFDKSIINLIRRKLT